MRTNVLRTLPVIAVILSSPVLTACDKAVAVKATKPPPELLTCQAEPATPDLPDPGIERDRLVLGYVLALRAAYGDCAAKVSGVRAWSDALPD